MFTRYTQRRKTKFRRENVYRFLFSLSVEFLNHVNKFCAQYKLYVFKNLKVRNKLETELIIYLPWVLCLSVCDSVCVCHNCGTLCYSFSFSNQTDQGDETEGLEREG